MAACVSCSSRILSGEQLGVSKDVRVTSYHGMFEENLKKHLSNKMLAVYVFEHFESFRSIQFEFGKNRPDSNRIFRVYFESGVIEYVRTLQQTRRSPLRSGEFGPEYLDFCAVLREAKRAMGTRMGLNKLIPIV